MRLIQETSDGDNILEFIMHTSEARSLIDRNIVCMSEEIDGKLYQIGVRTGSAREVDDDMPLIKSSKPAAVSANISEMVKAGHPKDQAVAAAMSVARKASAKGSKKKNKKKGA